MRTALHPGAAAALLGLLAVAAALLGWAAPGPVPLLLAAATAGAAAGFANSGST